MPSASPSEQVIRYLCWMSEVSDYGWLALNGALQGKWMKSVYSLPGAALMRCRRLGSLNNGDIVSQSGGQKSKTMMLAGLGLPSISLSIPWLGDDCLLPVSPLPFPLHICHWVQMSPFGKDTHLRIRAPSHDLILTWSNAVTLLQNKIAFPDSGG